MRLRQTVAALMILMTMPLPCTTFAAEEDRELAPIAAEQPRTNEKLGDVNPALTEKISTERTQETDKDVRKRKKKLKQTRKEKEQLNERKLKENSKPQTKSKDKPQDSRDDVIIIDPNEPAPQPVNQPQVQSQPQQQSPQQSPSQARQQQTQPQQQTRQQQTPSQTRQTPQPNQQLTPQQIQREQLQSQQQIMQQAQQMTTIETVTLPDQKLIYANFAEVARAVHFIPLYMPRKSGYEITALYAAQGVAEVRYGRRWEPTVSLTVRTYRRADGEDLKDISGVTGVKWRIDTTTGTTIYIAKISDTQQVAAWAVGHYTFSAQAENLSFAGFHSLVADELVELSTHYYLDL